MLRPGKTIRQSVGDPTGAIDNHRRNDRLASRVPQLTDDIAQTLRRQLALAFVPLGDRGRGFCRSSTIRTALHLVCRLLLEKKKKVTVEIPIPDDLDHTHETIIDYRHPTRISY